LQNQSIRRALVPLFLIAIFGVFLFTMHPVFNNNDSPETAAAALTMGICHPPGYPLFSMAAKIFTLIPAANPAFRVNLFASFLALMVLVMAYLSCLKITELFQENEKGARYWCALFILPVFAFSQIFWNQAIEAKGAIYMLNLVFFSVLVYIFIGLNSRFSIKYFYTGAFVYGLSLANHWPSMIILAPVLLYYYIIYFNRMKNLRSMNIIFFFALGLTPYLYLPIRAYAHPPLNWGDPEGLKSILWVVLRRDYPGPVAPSAGVYLYMAGEYVSAAIKNYWMLLVLAVTGGVVLYKKSKKDFLMLMSVYLITVLFQVLYNLSKKEALGIMDIFLMPAQYITALLMAPGAVFIWNRAGKKVYRTGAAAAFVVCFIFMFASNISINDNHNDFLSYDYGNNILLTMPPGSLYISEGDYNSMPVYYIQEVQKKRKDVIAVTSSFMIFRWGIDDFYRKYGKAVELEPMQRVMNIDRLIGRYADTAPVFISGFSPENIKLDRPVYLTGQDGLLTRISVDRPALNPDIFRAYSYRNIIHGFKVKNENDNNLIKLYAASMVNEANTFMENGRLRESLDLYEHSLMIPADKPDGNIMYNISLVYNRSNDINNELKYLMMAEKKRTDIQQAYIRLGILYYNYGMFDNALSALKKAAQMGGVDETIMRGIGVIDQIPASQRKEIALMKAGEHLIDNDIDGAMIIYQYLLENKYKTAIIYKNIGVYHFKTKNYRDAVDYFAKSENETPDPGTEFYIAYTDYLTGNNDQAVLWAEKGLKTNPSDKALLDLYARLKEFNNGKSNGGSNRP